MKSRVVLVGVLGVVVLLLIWNFLFFAPAGKDADKAKQNRADAEQQGQQLDQHLAELQKISTNAPEQKAQLDKLNAAIPLTPDLEGFIRSAVDLEQQAGVDWVDIEPSTPTPSASGGSEIKMTIVVSGGFFQVLDYLNRLEALSRIVVVDGINITTGSAANNSSGSSGSTPTTTGSASGAPNLAVTLTSRMFTQASSTSGTTTGPGGTGSTTPTTAAAPNTTPTTAGASG
jgi:Tfp pilus assembly protein PilO